MSLEMLTKAADLVETQEKQRLMEPPPSSDVRKAVNHVQESKPGEVNGDAENQTNGTSETRRQEHLSQNGRAHDTVKRSPGADSARTLSNHDGKGNLGETKPVEEASSDRRVLLDRYYTYQQRVANGSESRVQGDKVQRTDESSTARQSPENYQTAHRRSASPAADRGGDPHPSTKPMVLLQHPTATTLSSVGSAHTVPLSNPSLHGSTMHHPYLYSLMYPTGAIDPAISALGRAPGSVLKDGEAQGSSPNGSPNASIQAPAGMHFPAGFMYPFANQALLMNARAIPGAIPDVSPLLLAQPSAAYSSAAGVATPNPVIDQYKRLLEGMQQFPSAYSLQPQLAADQYIKSLTGQGLDVNKDALAFGGMAGRLHPGISLAALQGQQGANDLWMRYPDQFNAAMGMLRPQDGISPRSASPYANKRRTESPVISNGGKIAPSSYPYHASLAQSQLNSLSGARAHERSPAALFSQVHRSRSPTAEVRKPEAERSGYRSHSRDLDRDAKPVTKDLASTSLPANHNRSNNEHLGAHSYSVTDENGRKIQVPHYYTGHSVHVPHGYAGMGMPALHPGQERSPSPYSRSEDRAYHRAPRDRSPGPEIQNKRRSLDSQLVARNSPASNDRHNSRPTSPTTNGQIPTGRHQMPLVNGNTEGVAAAAAAAELAKSCHPLLLPVGHTRSPNQGGFGGEGREQRSCSPATNPYLAGMPSYFASHAFLGGLAGTAGSPLILPAHYAQAQALAATAKGADLASFYKQGDNVSEYARIAGLPLGGLPLSLLHPQHQQQLLAGSRPPHVLQQEYAAALKAQSYLASQAAAKESGKASPANGRDKHPGLPQSIYPGMLGQQQPPPALSPAKVGLKQKHSPGPQMPKGGHHPHDTHSPTAGVGSSALSSNENRRYHSPNVERQARDTSPKPSSKPYRPNSMLRLHAGDLQRSKKRKLEEETAMGDETSSFHQGKHLQGRPEQRDYLPKEARKDPKRRKQLISAPEGDPDIEEHFRRSLGKDYKDTANKVSITGSVDEHFKKALGGVWDQLQTTSGMSLKSEPRDVAPHTTHALPSYATALASATQSPRVYPPIDGKESLRMYDQAYLARERFYNPATAYMQGLSAHQKKSEKSPPRAAAPPTVLYPPNPPIGPARQKVKAKAVFPEVPPNTADLTGHRPVRANSLGSKGSSRSVSGSSAESLPTALAKSPTLPPSEGVSRPIAPPTISTAFPYTFAPQQSAANSVTSHSSVPVVSSEGSSLQRQKSSPTSTRGPTIEEHIQGSPKQKFLSTAPPTEETGDRLLGNDDGKSST